MYIKVMLGSGFLKDVVRVAATVSGFASLSSSCVSFCCPPGECKSVTCDYRHFCGYLQRRSGPLLICHCPYYNCTAKYNPVCGYDGNNYNSICHLQSEECYQNRFIGLRQFGRCPGMHEENPLINIFAVFECVLLLYS